MSSQRVDGRGHRILVIDDDLAIRVLLQAVLQRVKFDVDLAEDGEVGLERLRTRDYDLILLDLMMPKINGYEFLEALNRQKADGRPHIIVFTAAGPRGIEKIPDGAVCASILKPFDLEKFLELIEGCLHGHAAATG